MDRTTPNNPFGFETITAGEYIAWPKAAAANIRSSQCTTSEALQQLVGDRQISTQEWQWLVDKTNQTVLATHFEGDGELN